MRPNAERIVEPAKFRGRRNAKMRALSLDVMGEAVAGHLWMHLNVPKDASKTEMEECAHAIVRHVHADAPESAVAALIASLQSHQFCQRADQPAIQNLARQAVAVIRLASAPLSNAA